MIHEILGTLHKSASLEVENPSRLNNTAALVNNFPVVCVGGSAGGLDAYIRLLQNLPAELGVCPRTLQAKFLPQYIVFILIKYLYMWWLFFQGSHSRTAS